MFTRPLFDDIKLLLTAVGELRLVNRTQVTMAVTMLIIAPLLVITAPALFAHLPPWLIAWIRTPLELSIYHEWSDAIEIGSMHMESVYAPLEATVFGALGAAIAIGAVQVIGFGMGMYFLTPLCGREQLADVRAASCWCGGCRRSNRSSAHAIAAAARCCAVGNPWGAHGRYILGCARAVGRKELLTELRTVRQTLRQI